MRSFSVVTLVKGRPKQLTNVLESISLSTVLPTDIVVVWMEQQQRNLQKTFPTLNIKEVSLTNDPLPLAKARNYGASLTQSDTLIFLDVDCLCSPTLFSSLLKRLQSKKIVSAPVRYLSIIPFSGVYGDSLNYAQSHPKRDALPKECPVNYKNFWSLIFAIAKSDYNTLGGFDECFTGYGGEDTDFAERFNATGMTLEFVDDEALHQYHLKYDPPINYLTDISSNANLFYDKHGYFPMYKWLNKFCHMGFLGYHTERNKYYVLRLPTKEELHNALSTLPY